jgi:signal transduction histidine kinase
VFAPLCESRETIIRSKRLRRDGTKRERGLRRFFPRRGKRCPLPTKSPIAKEHGHQRLRLGFDVSSIGSDVENRLVVDIEDECGGLPEGKLEKLFDPFLQSGTDRTGFGLGLAIAK